MDKLNYLKKRLEKSFDVKYRSINSSLGYCTLVFIDDLCNTTFMSEYVIEPLTHKDVQCNKVEDIVE